MKRALSILIRTLLLLVALVLVGALVLAYLLRTHAGRQQLEAVLRAHLPGELSFAGLSGPLPFRGRLETLTLRDAEGVWLEAREIEWSLHKRGLLSRELVFDSARVAEVRLLRAPVHEQADQPPTSSGSRWRVWVQHARIGDLQVADAVVGEPVRAQVVGSFRQETDGWSVAASADARWREENLLVVGSARQSAAGAEFHLRQVETEGLRLEARGAWKPTVGIVFSGAWSNAPLLARLAGVEWNGEGTVTGRVEQSEHLKVIAEATLRNGSASGVSDVTADLSAEWVRNEGWRVFVSRADALFAGDRVRVEEAAIRGSGDEAQNVEWNVPSASWAGVPMHSSGYWSSTHVGGALQIPHVPLADSPLARWFTGGVARAEVHVSGSRKNPEWRAMIEGDALNVRMPGAFQPNPAQLRVRVAASSGVARVRAELAGWTAEAATLEAAAPVWLGAEGRFGIESTGAVQAVLHLDMQLAELGAFTDLRGAEIGGALTCDIEVGGSWSEPTVEGRIALTGGRAAFPDSGTALRNVDILLEGDRAGLVIRRAQADDGAGGRISAEGQIRFDPARKLPLDGAITLDRATVWRAQGSVVRLNGRLRLEGAAAAPVVTGRLDVAEAEIRLRPSPPPLPRLPIADSDVETRPDATGTSWLHAVSVDIGVFGREIRVLGRGLDSTWRADMRVDGPADALRLRGSIAVERGFFLFLGRRFSLDRAVVTLDGRRPPAPLIDLTATSRAGEMQARLFAAGPIEAPSLNMESEPAYPVDEILARLLFGRSTDSITPFQAVRLAHGLNILRGRGRTLDVLERGQSMLRVDQLEIVQSEEDAAVSAISVGKYVGRNVYVEGEKSFNGAADLITVEVELTPSLILTTESSPRIRDSIGLKWRRDY